MPVDKIISRYAKALKLIPQLIGICDICHIYDNFEQPFRIFKKRKDECFIWQNNYWSQSQIEELTKIKL